MLSLDKRQRAILQEIGIRLPWQTVASIDPPAQKESVEKNKTTHLSRPTVAPTVLNVAQKVGGGSHEPAIAQESLDSALAQQRERTIAQLSWEDLAREAGNCQACALCKSRKKVVFSAGESTAKWMIIGEAPGEQEDKQGLPFVGPAGQLLDRMLAHVSLSRKPDDQLEPVYIANVLKCRPPHNRNPEGEEIRMCEPFLKRQIELIQPKVLLLLGRFAVHSLLQTSEAIGRLRGQVHDYKQIPTIVTYHPAYLLRNPIDKRKTWEDLCLAARVFSEQG